MFWAAIRRMNAGQLPLTRAGADKVLIGTHRIAWLFSWRENFVEQFLIDLLVLGQSISKQADREEPFHLADGSTSKVKMMRQKGLFQYAKMPGYEVVALPYVGNRFAMYCFLPNQSVDTLD
jgi:Serpin (serine protease inhibitor)